MTRKAKEAAPSEHTFIEHGGCATALAARQNTA
jgi:hypothetical protein